MKILLLGYGKMGKAIAYGLTQLGHELTIVDDKDPSCVQMSVKDLTFDDMKDYDVVVSSLPYYLNLDIAKKALQANVSYCDLGGHVDTSEQISFLAKSAQKSMISDIGLAPGLINIMSEQIYRENPNIDQLTMMVGGLPQNPHPDDPFKYTCTWSVSGLINEMVDDCLILEDGKIVKVPALSILTKDAILFEDYKLEAFNTSGGAAHTLYKMQERGVKNCYYMTLRYEGHRNMITWMLKSGINRDNFEKLIKTYEYPTDVVVMIASAIYNDGTPDKIIKRIIKSNDRFSAMQIATGFSACSVIHLMKDCKIQNYEDVPYEQFNYFLDSLLN